MLGVEVDELVARVVVHWFPSQLVALWSRIGHTPRKTPAWKLRPRNRLTWRETAWLSRCGESVAAVPVPKVGVEPTWPLGRAILSRVRLPFRHFGLGP